MSELAIFQANNPMRVTKEMQSAFDSRGYILVRGLLNPEELGKLRKALERDGGILRHAFELSDGEGKNSKLCLWNHPGSDITGVMARVHKIAGTTTTLLGGDVYHYHTKLMMKEARTGGKHVWHQDYGYWYLNGCLRPSMATVFIALDPSTKENGCLEILEGSHLCGRIEHITVGGQTGADMDRVRMLMAAGNESRPGVPAQPRYPHRVVEMQPGDALFFHCNLLHSSGPNPSPNRRWAFLVAYNRVDNDPVLEHHHPCYTPLELLDDSALLACSDNSDEDLSVKHFMDPKADKTIKVAPAKERQAASEP